MIERRVAIAVVAVALVGTACTDAVSPDGDVAAAGSPTISSPGPSPSDPSGEGSEGSDPAIQLGAPDSLRPSEWVMPYRTGRMIIQFTGRPDLEELDDLLAMLDEELVTASFFIPGRWVSSHPEEARSIVSGGHALGNAGWHGRAPAKRSRLKRWIRRGENAFAGIGVDPRPFLFVPRRDMSTLEVAGKLGYRHVRASSDVTSSLKDGAGVVARIPLRDKPVSLLRRVLRNASRADVRTIALDRLTKTKPVAWDVTLAPGAEGPQVDRLQRLLNNSRYAAGTPDGTYGSLTIQAVYAFEKYHGLERDGIVDPGQLGAMLMSAPPEVDAEIKGHHFTIDITRQLLFEIDGGDVVRVVAISSANGQPYESRGNTYVARTPRGTFEIERKIPDWRISHLGALYYPSYFVGGYAVHGSTSVPPYPASHGCIRVPMGLAVDIYERMAIGTPVIVHD